MSFKWRWLAVGNEWVFVAVCSLQCPACPKGRAAPEFHCWGRLEGTHGSPLFSFLRNEFQEAVSWINMWAVVPSEARVQGCSLHHFHIQQLPGMQRVSAAQYVGIPGTD